MVLLFLGWPLCPRDHIKTPAGMQGLLALVAQHAVGLVSTGHVPCPCQARHLHCLLPHLFLSLQSSLVCVPSGGPGDP